MLIIQICSDHKIWARAPVYPCGQVAGQRQLKGMRDGLRNTHYGRNCNQCGIHMVSGLVVHALYSQNKHWTLSQILDLMFHYLFFRGIPVVKSSPWPH
jgi:hypothetical protein